MIEPGEGDKRREVLFFTNRVIREIPLNWAHPKDKDGDYVPLLNRKDYPHSEEEMKEFLKEQNLKSKKEVDKIFMPDFSKTPPEEMGISAYEETSEGTLISPIFPNTPEGRFQLLKHCTENETVFGNNKANIEIWAGMLFGKATVQVNLEKGIVVTYPKTPPKGNPQ